MVGLSRRKLERAIEQLADEADPDPSAASAWRDFISGAWIGEDPDELDPRIERWLDVAGVDDPENPGQDVPAYVPVSVAYAREHDMTDRLDALDRKLDQDTEGDHDS